MANLNVDCWQLVFKQLEPETRTLYACLFVSKTFFQLSVKALYRRPLHLFAHQTEFSPFSVYRLANLMDLCSGFTTPVIVQPVITGGSAHQNRRSKSTKITEPSIVSLFSSRDFYGTTLSVKIKNEIQVHQPIVTLPTTINYFQLVQEYPRTVISRPSQRKQFPKFLNCFAETISNLIIYIQDLDTILLFVKRFRILNSLTIEISWDQAFESNNIAKVVEFVQAHNRYFPGVLKELPGSWLNWKEFMTIQEAIGGVTNQSISLKPLPSDQNLLEMNVSRLKSLRLYCPKGNHASGTLAAEFLKTCTKLECLEMNWPMTVKFDWSLLLKDKVSDGSRIVVGGVGGLIVEEPKKGDGFGVFKIKTGNSDSSTSPRTQSLSQLQQPGPTINLRHLTVWDHPLLMIEAMQVFKDSLESIKLSLQYDGVHRDETFDWKSLFSMSKLKSIESDHFYFAPDNLSCCPVLETLTLKGDVRFSYRSPLNSTWPTIPVTLRKLHLSRLEMDGLEISMLKPLRNLEFLHLEPFHSSLPSTKPVDMSTGWYFPKLKYVVLHGKFALQFQGQILWIAPKLEDLRLNFWIRSKSGMLDINTFLFPPSELDFRKASSEMDGIPNLVPLTLVSTASFPVLKTLGLKSFQVSNSTAEQFADIFFGPQPSSSTIMVAEKENNDSEKNLFERNDRKDNDHHYKDSTRARFLFPNLEQLELYFDTLHNLFYPYFTPCVFKAMKFMPKLERIHYSGEVRSWEHPWLQALQVSYTGYHNIDHRNRPLATKLSTTTTTTTTTTLSRFWKKQAQNTKVECVFELDYYSKRCYRLDEVNVNFVNRTKRSTLNFLDHVRRAL